MAPIGLRSGAWHLADPALDITGVEVVGLDPRVERHSGIFITQRNLNPLRADFVHVVDQPAHEIAEHVDPQRPRGAEVTHHPHHVGYAREQHAAIVDRIVPFDWLAVDLKRDATHHQQVESGAGDDDIRLDVLPRSGAHARFGKAVDRIGDHGQLARRRYLEQIAIGAERQPLLPWAIGGSKMRLEREIVACIRADQRFEFVEHHVGLGFAALGQHVHIVHHLRADDAVDGRFVDADLAQAVGQFVLVGMREEIRRRTLEHGHVRGGFAERGHDGRGGRARTDHQHALAGVVDRRVPHLGMDKRAFIIGHAGPIGHVRLFVIIIALAHPQQVGGEGYRNAFWRAAGLAGGFHRPQVVRARPAAGGDAVAIMNMRGDAVLVDHFTHVFEDLGRTGDRWTDPRLEAIAERVKIRIRSHARVLVRFPGATERVLGFDHRIAFARTLVLQMIRRSDPRNAGADDQHIDVLDFALGLKPGACCVHRSDILLTGHEPDATLQHAALNRSIKHCALIAINL